MIYSLSKSQEDTNTSGFTASSIKTSTRSAAATERTLTAELAAAAEAAVLQNAGSATVSSDVNISRSPADSHHAPDDFFTMNQTNATKVLQLNRKL